MIYYFIVIMLMDRHVDTLVAW